MQRKPSTKRKITILKRAIAFYDKAISNLIFAPNVDPTELQAFTNLRSNAYHTLLQLTDDNYLLHTTLYHMHYQATEQ